MPDRHPSPAAQPHLRHNPLEAVSKQNLAGKKSNATLNGVKHLACISLCHEFFRFAQEGKMKAAVHFGTASAGQEKAKGIPCRRTRQTLHLLPFHFST